jgi:hypothetical protein
MNGSLGEVQLVSLVALLGWLILMLGAYRSHRIGAGKTLRLALIWAALFAAITFIFTLIMQ